jgi:hypothetical protein
MRVPPPLACVSLIAIAMAALVVINPFGRNIGVRYEPPMMLITQSR